MIDESPETMHWRKSRASGAGNCVEVAAREETVYVRNSKAPRGPALAFTTAEWSAFVTGVLAGEFSLSRLAS